MLSLTHHRTANSPGFYCDDAGGFHKQTDVGIVRIPGAGLPDKFDALRYGAYVDRAAERLFLTSTSPLDLQALDILSYDEWAAVQVNVADDRSTRLYVSGGNVYLIRDRAYPQERQTSCEYAVLPISASEPSLVWHPCEEGVEFSKIQPVATLGELAARDQQAHP